jgi:hypothetical protein
MNAEQINDKFRIAAFQTIYALSDISDLRARFAQAIMDSSVHIPEHKISQWYTEYKKGLCNLPKDEEEEDVEEQ